MNWFTFQLKLLIIEHLGFVFAEEFGLLRYYHNRASCWGLCRHIWWDRQANTKRLWKDFHLHKSLIRRILSSARSAWAPGAPVSNFTFGKRYVSVFIPWSASNLMTRTPTIFLIKRSSPVCIYMTYKLLRQGSCIANFAAANDGHT